MPETERITQTRSSMEPTPCALECDNSPGWCRSPTYLHPVTHRQLVGVFNSSN